MFYEELMLACSIRRLHLFPERVAVVDCVGVHYSLKLSIKNRGYAFSVHLLHCWGLLLADGWIVWCFCYHSGLQFMKLKVRSVFVLIHKRWRIVIFKKNAVMYLCMSTGSDINGDVKTKTGTTVPPAGLKCFCYCGDEVNRFLLLIMLHVRDLNKPRY